jgi:hypothetical protein
MDLLIAKEPRNADRLYDRALLALELKDGDTARALLGRLEELAGGSGVPTQAATLARELRARLGMGAP